MHKKEKANEYAKVQESNEKPKEGFEKVLEPLKEILDVYKARLRPQQTLEERLKSYTNPIFEIK